MKKAYKGRTLKRSKVMKVLNRVFEQGGYRITVRSYNEILTGLGFRLGQYTKPSPHEQIT